MLTAEQLIERKNYLGSSDAPAVLAMSRWDRTPLSVWAEKTGAIPHGLPDSLHLRLGHRLEEVVAELFEEKTGKKVRRVNETIFHPRFAFMAANIDRRVVGENAILEIKTTDAWGKKDWEKDEIPQDVIIQVLHQLMVTGMSKAYVAVLIGNKEFKHKEILRDEKLLADLERREVEFWNEYVLKNVMPAVTQKDADTLDALFPEAMEGKVIQLPDEANQIVEALDSFVADYKNLEGMIEQQKNLLKKMIGDAGFGETSLHRIGWTNSKWSGLDGDALREAYPEIHSKFYKSKPTRRFTHKKLREREK